MWQPLESKIIKQDKLLINFAIERILKVKLGIYTTLSRTWSWLIKTLPEWFAMTLFPFDNLTEIGLIWLYDVKWVKDEQIWSVTPVSIIQ